MAEAFADTSGWAEHVVKNQPFHAAATAFVNLWRTQRTRVITTNYVLAELVSLLTRPLRVPRPQQVTILDTIRTGPWVEVIHIDPQLDSDAWKLWKSRPDKAWSLVDCASFVVMQRRAITEALTTDHHFEQAGFVRLLK